MSHHIAALLLENWIVLVLAFATIHFLGNYFHNNLYKYPGPSVAHYTNLWRFFDVLQRQPHITHLRLHRTHGDVVRLGPNVLSFANPKALKTIYGLNKGFVKSEFYPVQQAFSNGKPLPSLFSTTDESFHSNLRRCVNSAFSMTALVHYEPMVNEVVELFLDKTDNTYAKSGQICDFSQWLQFFAFDVIGQITYSRRHGFIDEEKDIDGIVKFLGSLFSYVAPIGQMPWLDRLLMKNPIILLLDKLGVSLFAFPVARFAKKRMLERAVQDNNKHANDPEPRQEERADLLSQFLKAKTNKPQIMTDQRVLTMAISMAFAGSETTAISLSAVFYYLLRNPSCYRKLQQELDDAATAGVIEDRPSKMVTWSEAQKLPYLDACIKEAFRMHPAAGLPLERVVPAGGIEIDGQMIPGGTIVGCSAWVIHKREEVFGDEIDNYVPERWIHASPEKLKEMNRTMFQFGTGSRTCIGKNISLLEIYKLVPSFLRRFEISFADEENRSWKLHNAWFVKQLDFKCAFRARCTNDVSCHVT